MKETLENCPLLDEDLCTACPFAKLCTTRNLIYAPHATSCACTLASLILASYEPVKNSKKGLTELNSSKLLRLGQTVFPVVRDALIKSTKDEETDSNNDFINEVILYWNDFNTLGI